MPVFLSQLLTLALAVLAAMGVGVAVQAALVWRDQRRLAAWERGSGLWAGEDS